MHFDGSDKGEASGTKRETKEGGVGEDEKPKISKGTCSRLIKRRACRRLRRQKINEKMKALQEVIPNCSKRGQISILEDAINYINNMQSQLQQMMLIRAVAVCSALIRPMIPGPGMQIPRSSTDEMKYEIGMGAVNMLPSSSYFPTGLPNSYFPAAIPSAATADHEQKSTRRSGGSTVRVLPTQIILPRDDHVSDDFSHSGSSEWLSISDSE